ncbi:MAG: hypothetical protein JO020_24550 [Chloroflexi bacterium]|nr:hypothetical protein [Chloroflexota bacterium]MBV9134485.1 hypothetical protein [Chloroflexota bacterium]MBV9897343.1 hypothetical protein [Chloroflexota bacterium]
MRILRSWRLAASLSVAAAALFIAQSAFADVRDFTLTNNSSVDIASVYVSPTGVNSWGSDAMGTDILASGQTVNMNFTGSDDASCVYDIKVVGTQGEEGYLYKVDLCSVSQVTFGDK